MSPGVFPRDVTSGIIELLIIGLNPSYSINGWKSIFKKVDNKIYTQLSPELLKLIQHANKKEEIDDDGLNTYFSYSNWRIVQKDLHILEKTSFENHQYFKQMRTLAEDIYKVKNPPWNHLDLYYYRKTKQNELKKLEIKYPHFFEKQLNLSKNIIAWLKPKIILVANANACKIFRDKLYQKELKFNGFTGTYELILNNEFKTHVFFSGMLSGQHMLDTGSYKRFNWHIKAVHNKKSMK